MFHIKPFEGHDRKIEMWIDYQQNKIVIARFFLETWTEHFTWFLQKSFQIRLQSLRPNCVSFRQSSWQFLCCMCRNIDPTIAIVQMPWSYSIERFNVLSLSSLVDWIIISNCVAKWTTTAFIPLSIPLENILQSSNCDCESSSPSLVDSPEWWTSPTSTSGLNGVLFSYDMLEEGSIFSCIFLYG